MLVVARRAGPSIIGSRQVACGTQTPPPTRCLTMTAVKRADFAHVVIGGGVVGLAVARALAQRDPATVILERHRQAGQETSSRNSEVVHAGLYYGAGTLKTALCVRGRELLYALCTRARVAHRRTGKWVVAQDAAEHARLDALYRHCAGALGGRVPVRWVAAAERARCEPAVRAAAACLESPATGIVDSHALMLTLLAHVEHAGGIFSPGSAAVAVTPHGGRAASSPPFPSSNTTSGRRPGAAGWDITVRDVRSGSETTVSAETVVNAAGLGACDVHNMMVGDESGRRITAYYAKGNYFSYSASQPSVGRLIYPAPRPGQGGLGTHLTLDLAGRIRFGPDVEWVDSPDNLTVSDARLPAAIDEIRRYLPGIDAAALRPDYAGIRPKLSPRQAVMDRHGFDDFVIRKEDGYEGWVNLLGIESPGLTSCLAIGEMVEALLYR